MFYGWIKKPALSLFRMPLSWRLGLSTFAIALLTLIVISLVFNHSLNRRLGKEYQSHMRSQLSEMTDLLREMQEPENNQHTLLRNKWIETELKSNWQYYTRLIDKRGEHLAESENMPISLDDFLAKVTQDNLFSKWMDKAGKPYLLARQSAYEGDVFLGHVQVARSMEQDVKRNQKLKEMFVWLSFLCSVLIGLFAGLVSHRTLRPINQMGRQLNQITAADLSSRLYCQYWPKELRPLAASFDRMFDRLEEGFERLSSFSSDIAHELRTPLHALTIELDVILSRARTLEEYKSALVSAQESVSVLTRMVENMLFIARADNRVAALCLKQLDLRVECEKVKEFFQPILDEEQVDLVLRASGTLQADEQMLTRALVNLVSNAIRHTPPGGVVSLTSWTDDGGVLVSVADSGPGFAEKDLEHVFDRFFRVDSSRARQTGSSGLGLAIVRSIMSMHQGHAKAGNRAQGGGEITLYFPQKK